MKPVTNNLAYYNGKVSEVFFPRNQGESAATYRTRMFSLAAYRVSDNAREGYVLTNEGQIFHVTSGKSRCQRISGEEQRTLEATIRELWNAEV